MLVRDRKCLLVLLLIVASVSAFAQPDTTSRGQLPKKSSLVLTLGLTTPRGREGLREFWLSGPSASLEFLIHTNRQFALGVGVDYSILFFNQSAFALRWPGVPLKGKDNITVINIFFDAMYSFLPDADIRPFIAAQVGAVFIGEALYREVVGGVRRTYYNVGGDTKLAVNVATGASLQLDSRIALLVQIKGTFVHNDPAVSVLAHIRAGVQYTL